MQTAHPQTQGVVPASNNCLSCQEDKQARASPWLAASASDSLSSISTLSSSPQSGAEIRLNLAQAEPWARLNQACPSTGPAGMPPPCTRQKRFLLQESPSPHPTRSPQVSKSHPHTHTLPSQPTPCPMSTT